MRMEKNSRLEETTRSKLITSITTAKNSIDDRQQLQQGDVKSESLIDVKQAESLIKNDGYEMK